MTSTGDLDLVWGCKAIAKLLGVTERACFHMLESGELPARQIGRRWVVSRRKLREHFEGEAA
ncbi:helix-turn-helix domain-containing protein [Paradevosia shaoguanensis]|uniref:helix-turn-helix domain-containing protein n=1 Tax=Paradevosia shaoguanensis TaxID=1335043 RepID=UPI0019343DD1|nr:helix-turn-helix domain-containing protein [Paradevosia shaoguanensis]